MDLFDLFSMEGNYEQRKVDCFKKGKLRIDTAEVYDSNQPYETAVSYPSYNDGLWIIVEQYNTIGEAREGHKAWVNKMNDKLPEELKDVSTCGAAQLKDMTNRNWRVNKKSN